jgi:hypothetical protein
MLVVVPGRDDGPGVRLTAQGREFLGADHRVQRRRDRAAVKAREQAR